jgi:serine protease inhibitor
MNTNTNRMANLCPFAFGLFSILAQNSTENVLLSPYSIATALSIAFAGVTLESLPEEQLGSGLGISSHADLPLLAQTILDSAASTQDTVG